MIRTPRYNPQRQHQAELADVPIKGGQHASNPNDAGALRHASEDGLDSGKTALCKTDVVLPFYLPLM